LYRKVLIAFDGSEDSRAALNAGTDLAALGKAEVVLLAVLDTGIDVAAAEAYASGTAEDEQVAETRALLDQEMERLRQRGIAGTTVMAFGHPPDQIIGKARELGADLVVIGHRTHGLWSRLANDAVGVQLVKNPPCSILVVPPRA
jgi:nucleotide-binding universal stress UspA family protein